MNKKEMFEISALNELATAVLHGKTTAQMLTGVIKVMQQRLGLMSG